MKWLWEQHCIMTANLTANPTRGQYEHHWLLIESGDVRAVSVTHRPLTDVVLIQCTDDRVMWWFRCSNARCHRNSSSNRTLWQVCNKTIARWYKQVVSTDTIINIGEAMFFSPSIFLLLTHFKTYQFKPGFKTRLFECCAPQVWLRSAEQKKINKINFLHYLVTLTSLNVGKK